MEQRGNRLNGAVRPLFVNAFVIYIAHFLALDEGLEERVADRRLLGAIHRLLKAKVVMPNGVKVSTDEGVLQDGPLAPLLSNIVLDEVDRELEQRGHRFVR